MLLFCVITFQQVTQLSQRDRATGWGLARKYVRCSS